MQEKESWFPKIFRKDRSWNTMVYFTGDRETRELNIRENHILLELK